MKITETLGVDVSKKTLDAHLHVCKKHKQFKNNRSGHQSLLNWMDKHSTSGEVLICFEHTGLYSLSLALFLSDSKREFCILSALEIKRSLGLVRGKSDKVDAFRIADYAWLRRNRLTPTSFPVRKIIKLRKLLSLRSRLIKQRSGFKQSLGENKAMLNRKDFPELFKIESTMIKQLDKQIEQINSTIKEIINTDEKLKEQYELITSIKGDGFVVASTMIGSTQGFTCFSNSRKFACYAGVAPFPLQSGTSLNAKNRVSHLANKQIKSLLSLAARSAIGSDPELKRYYERRVEEGKSKMGTLNIVCNKIISRIFAVINRGTPYVCLKKY